MWDEIAIKQERSQRSAAGVVEMIEEEARSPVLGHLGVCGGTWRGSACVAGGTVVGEIAPSASRRPPQGLVSSWRRPPLPRPFLSGGQERDFDC